MRRRDSCSCRLLFYGTRSLSFIRTIPVVVYNIPRSAHYPHALCPRNLYLYMIPACYRPLLVLLSFASAHPATYCYAYLPGTGILTDSTSCMALASGVLVRLWVLWFGLYVFKMLNQFELRVRQPLCRYRYKARSDYYASDEHKR